MPRRAGVGRPLPFQVRCQVISQWIGGNTLINGSLVPTAEVLQGCLKGPECRVSRRWSADSGMVFRTDYHLRNNPPWQTVANKIAEFTENDESVVIGIFHDCELDRSTRHVCTIWNPVAGYADV